MLAKVTGHNYANTCKHIGPPNLVSTCFKYVCRSATHLQAYWKFGKHRANLENVRWAKFLQYFAVESAVP